MKLILLAPAPYSSDGDASLRLDRLIQDFRRSDIELHCVCMEGSSPAPGMDGSIRTLPGPERRFWKAALQELQKLEPELLYCVGQPAGELKKLAKRFGCPYWVDLSQGIPLPPPGRLPFRFQQCLSGASGLICGSEAERKLWKERKQKGLFVLEQPSVLPEAAPSAHGFRHELRLTETAIFAQVSLDREEELQLLLKAFSRLPPELEASLVLSGAPQSRISDWRRQVQELPRSQYIHFLAPRPLSDLPELYKQADLILFPQLGPERPQLLPSAMAAGKAILSWERPAIEELGRDGSLRWAALSEADMARALRELLEQPELREELGQRAAARYRELNLEQRCQEQLQSLLKALRASVANHS